MADPSHHEEYDEELHGAQRAISGVRSIARHRWAPHMVHKRLLDVMSLMAVAHRRGEMDGGGEPLVAGDKGTVTPSRAHLFVRATPPPPPLRTASVHYPGSCAG